MKFSLVSSSMLASTALGCVMVRVTNYGGEPDNGNAVVYSENKSVCDASWNKNTFRDSKENKDEIKVPLTCKKSENKGSLKWDGGSRQWLLDFDGPATDSKIKNGQISMNNSVMNHGAKDSLYAAGFNGCDITALKNGTVEDTSSSASGSASATKNSGSATKSSAEETSSGSHSTKPVESANGAADVLRPVALMGSLGAVVFNLL